MNHVATKTEFTTTTEIVTTTAAATPAAAEIHHQLKALLQTERKITEQILDLINQCERGRIYAKLGFSSMFEYLHQGLGYSEGAAQKRLSSARLLRDLPELKADLQKGDLNLTQVSMAHVAIRREEKAQNQKMSVARKKEIIEKLKNKNTFDSKAVLTNELPSFADQGRDEVTPVKENQVQITITLTQDQFEELQEARDYLSNSIKSAGLKDYLLYVTKKVLQKKKRVYQKQKLTAATAVDVHPDVNPEANAKAIQKLRPHIKQSLKKQLLQNADFQCQYVSKETQKRCSATRYLHVDHIRPVAFNGATSKENLRILCQAHNHLAAINSGLMSR